MSWTKTTRKNYDRRHLRYASDCLDEEWQLIAPLMLPTSRVGRPRKTDMRAVWDAIQYIAATGCQSLPAGKRSAAGKGRFYRRISLPSLPCNIIFIACVTAGCWTFSMRFWLSQHGLLTEETEGLQQA